MEHKNDRLPIFTERFRELQEGRSNTEFAYFLGISRQTVGFYCNGDRVPDAMTLIKISQKCGVSADWLLGLSQIRTPNEDIRKIGDLLPLSESAIQKLVGMTAPDDLGGDPGILYALNVLLEGLALAGKSDEDGYALLDIANYLDFRPFEDGDIPEHLLRKANMPDGELLNKMNTALEAYLLQEISNSLRCLRKLYYTDNNLSQELPF